MSKKLIKVIILSLIFVFSLTSFTLANEYNEPYDGPMPKEFNEAPMLNEMVNKGQLPSLEERIPEDPYVVEPIEKIGSYGGTIQTVSTTPDSWGEDTMMMDAVNFVTSNAEANEVIINFAKKIITSSDKTSFEIHLRKGVKWSDGYPFTADDIMFWYEDVLLNEELTPAISSQWKTDGEVMNMNKIDDYTIQITFSKPKPFFLNLLVHSSSALGYPKHYLKQFHPKYTSKEELNKKLEKSNYEEWYELFSHKNTRVMNIPTVEELPTLSAYKLVKKTSSRRVYERNPYFWKVDNEGNQLPYIDRIETDLVANREVLNGKILSGEVDFAGWNVDIRNYPMLKKYEDEGGFKTILWESGYGTIANYMLNLTHEDSNLREIFQNVEFRKALSLAINREEINDSIYFGKAIPRQYTVLDTSKYYEPEFATAYTEYNPEKAKKMLDEIGLDKKNSNGIRLGHDGNEIEFTIEYYPAETAKTPNVELVTEHWRDIGLNVNIKQNSGELQAQRAPANMMDATVWHDGFSTDILFFYCRKFVPVVPHWGSSIWPEWERWFHTEKQEGEEPPEQIKELYGWYEELQVTPDEDTRIQLGKKILRSQAENLWSIGTVGKTPYAIIASNNLKNVPKEGYWCWSTLWTMSRNPEQFYIEK